MTRRSRNLRAPLAAAATGLALLFLAGPFRSEAGAETYLYDGQMTSEVRIVLTQRYTAEKTPSKFTLKTGRFPSFSYAVNRQEIRDWKQTYDPPPTRMDEKKDGRGNTYVEAAWDKPSDTITCRTEFTAVLGTDFGALASKAPWPPDASKLTEEAKPYLVDSEMLGQKDRRVRKLAEELTNGARTQHEAVIRIMNYVVDNVTYLVNPDQYTAAYSLDTHRGNCQNYSHLVCALLHTQGVAARVVNGLSLTRPWRVPMKNGTITLDGALGRHAWIEVYYPDLGWVSFDPQLSHYFVSTHLVKQAVGVDSPETHDYGLLWGAKTKRVDEKIDPTFGAEANGFRLAESFPSPSNLIVTGIVRAEAGAVAHPAPPVGPTPSPAEPKPLLVTDGRAGSKDRIGETVGPKAPSPLPVAPVLPSVPAPPAPPPLIARPAFPRPTASPSPAPVVPPPAPTTGPAAVPSRAPSPPPIALGTAGPRPSPPAPVPAATPAPIAPSVDLASLTRFAEIGLVDISEDAAEYVTGGEEFAQRFEIRDPMVLWETELALYKFSDSDGTLRVEIHDDVDGLPAPVARMTSTPRPIAGIRFVPNYQWVGFNFRNLGAGGYLPKGRYWLVLKYTPDAIFNWHCRIGNPYLDSDDTRSRRLDSAAWDNIVNVDFNFLLTGVY